MTKNSGYFPILLLLVLSLIWGSSFFLIKRGLDTLTAVQVGAIRIFSASLIMAPVAFFKLKDLGKREFLLLLVIGLVGSLVPAFLFAIAQTELPSALTGVLNTLTPLFVIIMGALFFNKSIQKPTIIGILLGFVGTTVLIIGSSKNSLTGINSYAFLVVLATIMYGINLNVIKYFLSEINALTITSVSLLFMGPFSLVVLLSTDIQQRVQDIPEALEGIYYVSILGVVGTAVALILFNYLVKITDPVFTSSVTYIIPIVAIIWGVLDGERLEVTHYLGITLILMGVWIANRLSTKKK